MIAPAPVRWALYLALFRPVSHPNVSTWFAEEVQPHERALRIFLRTRFPAHPDIDDLVQETYARILKARELATVRSPKAFLFVTARNVALDFFRRRKIIAIDPLAEIDLLPVFDDRPGVAETVCHDQELQMLGEALQALPPRCRHVLTLRRIYGLSHAEIAAQLGISTHTVNAQIAIGVLRLRDYLRARGMDRSHSHE